MALIILITQSIHTPGPEKLNDKNITHNIQALTATCMHASVHN